MQRRMLRRGNGGEKSAKKVRWCREELDGTNRETTESEHCQTGRWLYL